MKITVTVDNPTADFQDRLLDLLKEHAPHVEVDATWTIERATQYFRALPTRARDILHLAAINDGFVSDEELRQNGGSLRGHSGALKRILERGVREGWWPANIEAPIRAEGPGFGKVQGYSMPLELVDVFSEAYERYTKQAGNHTTEK